MESRAFAETISIETRADLDKILQTGIYPDIITYATFRDDRLRGLGAARGSHFSIPTGFRRRPHNTLLPGR